MGNINNKSVMYKASIAGRWINFEIDYKTIDPDFMESVWWVFH